MRSGRVFVAVRLRDDVWPVKPWGVASAVAVDQGEPIGRCVHFFWTRRGAVGAADYLNRLLREDLSIWLDSLPIGRAARSSDAAAACQRRMPSARVALDPGEQGEVAPHAEGRQARRGAV